MDKQPGLHIDGRIHSQHLRIPVKSQSASSKMTTEADGSSGCWIVGLLACALRIYQEGWDRLSAGLASSVFLLYFKIWSTYIKMSSKTLHQDSWDLWNHYAIAKIRSLKILPQTWTTQLNIKCCWYASKTTKQPNIKLYIPWVWAWNIQWVVKLGNMKDIRTFLYHLNFVAFQIIKTLNGVCPLDFTPTSPMQTARPKKSPADWLNSDHETVLLR